MKVWLKFKMPLGKFSYFVASFLGAWIANSTLAVEERLQKDLIHLAQKLQFLFEIFVHRPDSKMIKPSVVNCFARLLGAENGVLTKLPKQGITFRL